MTKGFSDTIITCKSRWYMFLRGKRCKNTNRERTQKNNNRHNFSEKGFRPSFGSVSFDHLKRVNKNLDYFKKFYDFINRDYFVNVIHIKMKKELLGIVDHGT